MNSSIAFCFLSVACLIPFSLAASNKALEEEVSVADSRSINASHLPLDTFGKEDTGTHPSISSTTPSKQTQKSRKSKVQKKPSSLADHSLSTTVSGSSLKSPSDMQTLEPLTSVNSSKAFLEEKKKEAFVSWPLSKLSSSSPFFPFGFQVGKAPEVTIFPEPLEDTLLKIEHLMQQVIEHKREDPLVVSIELDEEGSKKFMGSLHELTSKSPGPLVWGLQALGSSSSFKLTLYSQAKLHERIATQYVYKSSPAEAEKIEWASIYELVRRAGFSVEHFKFNNALKIRTLELQGRTEEENITEIQQFLSVKLPKDSEPFHVANIILSKTSPVRADHLVGHKYRTAEEEEIEIISALCDQEEGRLLLCVVNKDRRILDLHGKILKDGKTFEGRNKDQARKETEDFIRQAYGNFKKEEIVLTGRGNHKNANGSYGVLFKAFKSWMKNKQLSSLLESYSPLEGNGGYKVKFKPIQKLNLQRISLEESIASLKTALLHASETQQFRFHLKLPLTTQTAEGNQGLKFVNHLCRDLAKNESQLFHTVAPIRFDITAENLRLILKLIHPRAGFSLSFIGKDRIEGTISAPAKLSEASKTSPGAK